MTDVTPKLEVFAPGAVWLFAYPVRYAGAGFSARMTVIRLADGRVLLHSPYEITPALAEAISAIGPVGWIVAPGNFHHLHVPSAQAAFPEAKTLICPGVEKKQPGLVYDAVLGDAPVADWGGEIAQVLVDGNRIIRELVFLHRPSRTLIVTDLIELIGDETEGVDRVLRFWWRWVTLMWNKPRPAPEYSMGWRDRKRAAAAMRRILDWEFDRIVIAHGDLITQDAKAVARDAWRKVLAKG